uniref:WAT1-related protein n=1 Tax=Ananas comosus var. bracteatus TaxID=296719 RepID=A0A6V7PYQ3_ANACO|nr:unnamed protein product [Ananas comosus var. bracteatus]
MEASFNRGLNPHVYTTYRHLVAGLVMFPFAYFLEKKLRPKLTWALFLEIQILSLLGISLTLNMYFASLRYTSPTFVASMVNTVASMTFVIAIFLRLEHLDAKSLRGMAKIVGTAVSLAGVTTMTLYKGPTVRNLWRGLIHIQGGVIHEEWVKGATLIVASCITWSMLYIMQVQSHLLTIQEKPVRMEPLLGALSPRQCPLSCSGWGMCLSEYEEGRGGEGILDDSRERRPLSDRLSSWKRLTTIRVNSLAFRKRYQRKTAVIRSCLPYRQVQRGPSTKVGKKSRPVGQVSTQIHPPEQVRRRC